MTLPITDLLEYAAFGGSICSAWLYGKPGIRGPLAGLCTSLTFMAFGYTAGIYAAVGANVIFIFVHSRNLKRALDSDMDRTQTKLVDSINYLVTVAHNASTKSGWWDGVDINNPLTVPAKLCLIHSEISEAMEGHRKNQMDDKLPHRTMIEVELADALLRIADLAGKMGLDLGGATAEKLSFNAVRPDHKPENRTGPHGKAY